MPTINQFITGLFGMNVAGLPGLENENAFLWLAFFMTALGGGILLLFRFNRWF